MTLDRNMPDHPPVDALFVTQPAPGTDALPIVFDSPHSSLGMPADFGTVAPREAILSSWDAFVDELWAGVPGLGGVLIGSRFARAYIDANRALTDIDAELLAEPWPEPLSPQPYTKRGMGLIRRYALPGVPLYARKLTLAEVRHRIDAYYQPYRTAVGSAIEHGASAHGAVWHVNCHSMKSRGNAMNVDAGRARPDVVVSDRLGTSADPAFTQWVAAQLGDAGLTVRVNDPYQGGDLVRTFGNPARKRHSIQIELNRALYMDETAFMPHAGFADLKRTLDTFAQRLAEYVREQLTAGRPHRGAR